MSAGLDYKISEVKLSFRKRGISNFDADEKTSLADSFIAYLSSTLGAGVLSMPLVFAYAGWLQAVGLIAFVAFLSYQSNYALLRVAQRVNGKSYADVAEKALGKSNMAFAVVFMFFLLILGGSISYLVVIHWAMSTTVGYLGVSFDINLPEYLSELTSRQRLGVLGFVGEHFNHALYFLPKIEELQLPQPHFHHHGHAGGHHHLLLAAFDAVERNPAQVEYRALRG